MKKVIAFAISIIVLVMLSLSFLFFKTFSGVSTLGRNTEIVEKEIVELTPPCATTMNPNTLYKVSTPDDHRLVWVNPENIWLRQCFSCEDIKNKPDEHLELKRSSKNRKLYFSTRVTQKVAFTTTKY